MHRFLTPQTLLKIALPLALVAGAAAGVLAQEAPAMPNPTHIIQAGGFGLANSDVVTFLPNNVQVHRGDTVSWAMVGFHNIHFEEGPQPLVIAPEVDGQPLLQYNPAVMFPTITSGGTFTGGDANSSITVTDPTIGLFFTLTIDAEVGTYNYFCDVHPGMSGSISVVEDSVELPSPQALELQMYNEYNAVINQAVADWAAMTGSVSMMPEAGEAEVYAGTGSMASVQLFMPGTIVIDAGESVTWEIGMAESSREIHTFTWPPNPPDSDIVFQEQEGGPPLLLLGANFINTVASGDSIGAGASYNYVITPATPLTLTFTDPGVYPYVCMLHPGMAGSVVVMPAGM